jgi:hypothetical protein
MTTDASNLDTGVDVNEIILAVFISGTPLMTFETASAFDCNDDRAQTIQDIARILEPFPYGVGSTDGSINRITDYSVACVPATPRLTALLQDDPS